MTSSKAPKSHQEEGKKLLPGALRESESSPARDLPEPGCRLVDIGGRIKNNQKHKTGYPTRPWARGPANYSLILYNLY